jgi:hypothetical protein
MQRTIFIGIVVILIGILVWLFFERTPVFSPAPIPVACTMEAKMCPDGSSVGRSGPNCEFAACPTAETPTPTPTSTTPATTTPAADNLIIIDTPKANQEVGSPITVTGKARGNWYFEASFPIDVTDWDGVIIGNGIAHAQGDWMTTEFVPFTASISYTLPTSTPYKRGTLILKKDNPSGLPQNADAREIPILFK